MKITVHNMPVLKPLPIKTKGTGSFWSKLATWACEIRKWRLYEDWSFYIKEDGGAEHLIVIPADFIFDGASVPRPFWSALSPTGLLFMPGLIHDYGYRYDQLLEIQANGKTKPYKSRAGKEFWDALFMQAGEDINGFSLVSRIAWLGVALGGGSAWDSHRRK